MANELVLVSSRPDDRDNRHDRQDQLGIELDAMFAIGRALDAIEDPSLRLRILSWANERWGVDRSSATTAPSQPRNATPPPASDPGLSVDSIGEMFGDGTSDEHSETGLDIVVPEPAGKAPVESVLKSLAADFQRLADEWNGDTTT